MNSEPIVFVVEDDAVVRETLCSVIESMGLRVKTFQTPIEYLEQFDPEAPGVLLLDVRMPIMSGLALQEALMAKPLRPPIVFLTGHPEVSTALRAMRHGAIDFLQKPASEAAIFDAIQRGIALDASQRAEYTRKQELAARFAQLSDTEREVLHFVLQGEANKRIATLLQISRRTVEDRRARMMKKLGAETLAGLVHLAIEANFQYCASPKVA